ncbi:hypothetical protein K432DRAFT_439834 [Lepidopterella palustris CBS 459.81]|uniref:Uncharacterized protein n=1 Tax=Lepidopterella palustris CBS 459.81 TaxID=1314670 RepID=A0A8E2JJF8_9PEZI|nr:hypothetical protein K432DRAFT_439834 [Lepidopterella palustris CBS 459.81]
MISGNSPPGSSPASLGRGTTDRADGHREHRDDDGNDKQNDESTNIPMASLVQDSGVNQNNQTLSHEEISMLPTSVMALRVERDVARLDRFIARAERDEALAKTATHMENEKKLRQQLHELQTSRGVASSLPLIPVGSGTSSFLQQASQANTSASRFHLTQGHEERQRHEPTPQHNPLHGGITWPDGTLWSKTRSPVDSVPTHQSPGFRTHASSPIQRPPNPHSLSFDNGTDQLDIIARHPRYPRSYDMSINPWARPKEFETPRLAPAPPVRRPIAPLPRNFSRKFSVETLVDRADGIQRPSQPPLVKSRPKRPGSVEDDPKLVNQIKHSEQSFNIKERPHLMKLRDSSKLIFNAHLVSPFYISDF